METKILKEGKAKFYASIDDEGKISRKLDVFYNPIMKFNRDVSILLMNALKKKNMQVSDILAGSGVRSMRFFLELNKGIIKNITINDNDVGFLKTIKKNLLLNKIPNKIISSGTVAHKKISSAKIILKNEDANKILIESLGFDYIDIDPFGSPVNFLENSVARISRDGILAITATDTAALCGAYPDACKRKYWSQPMNNYLMHEVGLRILIRRIQLIGAQYDKALIPIYSYSKDHYMRVFLSVDKGKKSVDEVLKQHKSLVFCNDCLRFNISEYNNLICECNSGKLGKSIQTINKQMNSAGPLWIGKLYDSKLCGNIFGNSKKYAGKDTQDFKFLKTIFEESKIDVFGFYDIHYLAKKYKFPVPPFDKIMNLLKERNYMTSRTHFSNTGIKTDCGLKELLELIKNM